MIVGFEVSPCSIKRTAGKPIEDIVCDNIDRVPTPQVQQLLQHAHVHGRLCSCVQLSRVYFVSASCASASLASRKAEHKALNA
jgi:hypothetical protein